MSFAVNLLQKDAVKFRENSADSIVYHLEGHTATHPFTMTITRSLPSPRKGNAGTLKLFVNVRQSIDIIGADGETKIVPLITKLESSVPVGAPIEAVSRNLAAMFGFTISSDLVDQELDADHEQFYIRGYLPDGSGSGLPTIVEVAMPIAPV